MPDLAPLQFCVRRYVKDKVFVPSLPASLEELKARITEVVAAMIHRITDGTSAV
jgi:hypothetical protein